MTLSKRHHYLPEVYLKGFTGEDGKLSVYDIRKKKLKKGRYSPKQVFFEWNRNTFDVSNQKTDFLENIYKSVDQRITPVLKKIQESSGDPKLDPYDFFSLIYFIGITYWRIPKTDKELADYVKTAERKDLFIKLLNRETNEEAPEEIFERLRNEKAFIESYRIPKAIIDYLKSKNGLFLEKWKISYSTEPPNLHLIGDNPILTFNDTFANILDTEIIFPISSSKSLWRLDSKFPKIISPETTATIDQLIFIQSERYVCGPNPDYLNAIAEISKGPYNNNIIKYLKHQVFGKI